MVYDGPLRDEPLAIELHNTIYATRDGLVDALADPATTRAWLKAIAPRPHGGERPSGAPPRGGRRLPGAWPDPAALVAGGRRLPARAWPDAAELVALRDAVRAALRAAAAGERPPRAALDAINAASRRAPRAAVAVWQPGEHPTRGSDVGAASRADVVLAAFAASAIDLVCGPLRDELRTCGAPRCVLMFVRDHPRREWCSDRCGNRARQARHYERHARHDHPAP